MGRSLKFYLFAPLVAGLIAANATVATAAPSVDVIFGRYIAQIRAHIATGEELIAQGDWKAAAPHFSFPTEEIYGIIRDDIRNYKAAPFDHDLKTLARVVKSGNKAQYAAAKDKVERSLAAVDAGVRTRQSNLPRFVLETAVETLKAAPDEYEDAVAKGRIIRPIGYQTARGFILHAQKMIDSVAPALEAKDAQAISAIRSAFAQLRRIFPTVKAPRAALGDVNAVLGAISRIELAAGKLI